jgi:hypothetical protein
VIPERDGDMGRIEWVPRKFDQDALVRVSLGFTEASQIIHGNSLLERRTSQSGDIVH